MRGVLESASSSTLVTKSHGVAFIERSSRVMDSRGMSPTRWTGEKIGR
jgi:hypothetical protein